MQLQLCVYQCGFAVRLWEGDWSSERVFWGRGFHALNISLGTSDTKATQADATFAEQRDEVI